MNATEAMIPMSFFAAATFVIVKFLEHRQRIRMIDKGITKVEFTEHRNRSINSVKYGMVTIALGVAIFMAQIFEEFVRSPFGGEIGLALVPIFVGVALIISAILEKRADHQNQRNALEMKSTS